MRSFRCLGQIVAIGFTAALVTAGFSNAAEGIMGLELVNKDGKVIIQKVLKDSPASKAFAKVGVKEGWQFYKIKKTKIKTFQQALEIKKTLPDNTPIRHVFKRPPSQVGVYSVVEIDLTFPGKKSDFAVYEVKGAKK